MALSSTFRVPSTLNPLDNVQFYTGPPDPSPTKNRRKPRELTPTMKGMKALGLLYSENEDENDSDEGAFAPLEWRNPAPTVYDDSRAPEAEKRDGCSPEKPVVIEDSETDVEPEDDLPSLDRLLRDDFDLEEWRHGPLAEGKAAPLETPAAPGESSVNTRQNQPTVSTAADNVDPLIFEEPVIRRDAAEAPLPERKHRERFSEIGLEPVSSLHSRAGSVDNGQPDVLVKQRHHKSDDKEDNEIERMHAERAYERAPSDEDRMNTQRAAQTKVEPDIRRPPKHGKRKRSQARPLRQLRRSKKTRDLESESGSNDLEGSIYDSENSEAEAEAEKSQQQTSTRSRPSTRKRSVSWRDASADLEIQHLRKRRKTSRTLRSEQTSPSIDSLSRPVCSGKPLRQLNKEEVPGVRVKQTTNRFRAVMQTDDSSSSSEGDSLNEGDYSSENGAGNGTRWLTFWCSSSRGQSREIL